MAGRYSIITTMIFAGLSITAQAREVREFYNGARALGMGGAAIAVVNDETSLVVNPAGLGKLRDVYGTVFDPEIEVSDNFYELSRSKPFGSFFSPDGVQPTLAENLGSGYHAKASMFPSFVVRNFGIGILGRYTLDAKMDPTGTELDTFYQDDLALLLGLNFKLWGGRIKLGVTGKFISRIEVDKSLPVAESMTIDANATEGAAIGADVGLSLTAPVVWLPTVSAVVRDVGGTKFNAGAGLRKKTEGRPNDVKQDIDVALAVFPIHSNKTRSTFTVEYQKLMEAQESSSKNRYMHVGYEYNYGDVLFLRAGMNQSYWTAGVEIASEFTQFQIAYYGEDIGTDAVPEEQRRWIMKFAFRF